MEIRLRHFTYNSVQDNSMRSVFTCRRPAHRKQVTCVEWKEHSKECGQLEARLYSADFFNLNNCYISESQNFL